MNEILKKRQQNAARPFCKLPAEIVSIIFLYLRGLCMIHKFPGRRCYRWLFATHICNHLREVALSTTHLWDRIRFRNKDLCQEFLRRSKNLPIDAIFMHQWFSNRSGALLKPASLMREMLEQLPRICGLYILLESTNFMDGEREHSEDDQWSDLPAPYLEELVLEDRYVPRTDDPGEPWLPDLLLRGDRPSLRHVLVKHERWDWTEASLPGTLTSFHATTEVGCMCSPARISKTLSTLRGLPFLEQLSLREYPSDPDGHESEDEDTQTHLSAVALPKLQILESAGSLSLCLNLLDNLSIPSGCYKYMDVADDVDYVQRSEEIVTVLNRTVFAETTQSVSYVKLRFGGYGVFWNLSLYASRTVLTDPTSSHPRGAEHDTDISFGALLDPISQPSWEALLYDVVGGLNLSSVRVLDLWATNPGDDDPFDVRRVLRQMPKIDTLRMWRRTLADSLSVIPTFFESNTADRLQIFLPNLRELGLSGVQFPVQNSANISEDGSGDVAEFIGRLRTRQELDIGITSLALQTCLNLTTEVVDALRSVVKEVHCTARDEW